MNFFLEDTREGWSKPNKNFILPYEVSFWRSVPGFLCHSWLVQLFRQRRKGLFHLTHGNHLWKKMETVKKCNYAQ